MKIRTFQELLFVIHTQTEKHVLSSEPETLAAQLIGSDLLQILAETHKGEAPFYFRIGVSGGMALEERSSFSRQTAAAIEKAFARKLINSTSHYEVEIRLLQNREGGFVPLKLYTLPDHRFDYRRYYVAAKMKPTMAAGLWHWQTVSEGACTDSGSVLRCRNITDRAPVSGAGTKCLWH